MSPPRPANACSQAIEELGYRPNASARALKRGVSETIGLIISDITNPYFSEYAHAIEEAAAERGLSVIFTNSALAVDPESEVIRRMILRGVDGLLLASILDEPELDARPSRRNPGGASRSRATGRRPRQRRIELPGGVPDRGRAPHLARSRADRPGHRVHGRLDHLGSRGRLAGCARSPRDCEPGPVIRSHFTSEGGFDAGIRMLQLDDRPTAVYVLSDQQSIGFLNAAPQAGLQLPGDLAVLSFDGTTESRVQLAASHDDAAAGA